MTEAALLSEYRAPRPGELETAGRLLSESFIFPRTWGAGITASSEPETLRVLVENGEMNAAAMVHPWRQYFGGQPIASSGPGALAVAPEARGKGVATRLLRHILDEGRAAGVPLSVLYPASRQLYAKAGYAPGGWRISRLFDPAKIGMRKPELPVRRMTEADHAAVRALHDRAARLTNGWLGRPEYRWKSLLGSGDELRAGWIVEQQGEAVGYAVTSVVLRGEKRLLQVEDQAALNPAAAKSLLSFIGGQAFQAHGLLWHGGSFEIIDALLPENAHKIEIDRWLEWCLRIADVPAALEARGYPESLDTELHLDVADDWYPENCGRFLVTIRGGKADVKRGGEGRVRIDVRALATLYASHRAPSEVMMTGALCGPPCDIEQLGFAFRGPASGMADMF
ncbi:MAG: hypothetical protein PWP23_1658 [Candidatus Sumerlaeota bacterium]|nr:hypothetical protein [Candidatus Sumerlaeota bacterium]